MFCYVEDTADFSYADYTAEFEYQGVVPGVRKFRATSGYEPRFTSKKLLFKALYLKN
jgi:hypothetical protein